MALSVKVCGVTNRDDAAAVARAGADFIGFILAPSPRQVSVDAVRDIMGVLPAPVEPVLVFRGAPVEEVFAALDATHCRWIQIHGHESVAYLGRLLAARPHLRLIRAWEIETPESGDALALYLRQAREAGVRIDVVLLDAPKGGPHPGFERLGDISHACCARPPAVWCAGGLTPGNLGTAVPSGHSTPMTWPAGVELAPGGKDRTPCGVSSSWRRRQ
jgi:phosphoribosylanthranilate isomerase